MSPILKKPGIECLSIARVAPLTGAQRFELDRRLQDHQANPGDVVSWKVVKASITVRLKS